MRLDETARELKEELEAALADYGDAERITVHRVEPPPDLGADTVFRISVGPTGGAPTAREMPTPLAMGYLADEEQAVDEWRHWVRELRDDVIGS